MILDTPETKKIQGGMAYIDSAVTTAYKFVPFAATASSFLTGTVVANRLYLTPFILAHDMFASEIAIHVNTATGTAGKVRLSLYQHDRSTGLPGQALWESGDIATNVDGYRPTTLNYVLRSGQIYWVGFCSELTFPTRVIANTNAINRFGHLSVGVSSVTNLYQDLGSGWTNMPSTPSSLTMHDAIPVTFFD